jgi:N utilization substance protein A
MKGNVMSQNTKNSEFDQFDASTAEEIDALEVNLLQDGDDIRDDDDGTGPIEDDVARDQIEGMTEVGPDLIDKGVESVSPGREDTSAALRRLRPTTRIARAEDQVESTSDEPRDEAFMDRESGEDTAA